MCCTAAVRTAVHIDCGQHRREKGEDGVVEEMMERGRNYKTERMNEWINKKEEEIEGNENERSKNKNDTDRRLFFAHKFVVVSEEVESSSIKRNLL